MFAAASFHFTEVNFHGCELFAVSFCCCEFSHGEVFSVSSYGCYCSLSVFPLSIVLCELFAVNFWVTICGDTFGIDFRQNATKSLILSPLLYFVKILKH